MKKAVLKSAAAGFLAVGIGAAGVFTAGAASAQTVTVWSGFPEMTPFYERVAKSMKSSHPGVTFDVQAIPLREHEKRVALGVSSGSTDPVIIEFATTVARRYVENDLLNKAPGKISSFVKNSGNFMPFYQDAAGYNGAIYGVPLFRGQAALYYNTEMFKAAGLSKPPATMEQFTDYASKLTKRDGNGNPSVTGWSLRLSGGSGGIAEKFEINMFQFGGARMVVEKSPGKWRVALNTKAGRAAFSQYLENVHTLKNVTVEAPADADAFERRQTAMFIRESWVIGDIAKKSPDLPYATAPLPYGANSLPVNLYVKAEGAAAEAAWAFALEANKPDHLIWLLDNVGWLPNRKADYSSVVKQTPGFAGFLNYPSDYEFFAFAPIGPSEEVNSRIASALSRAFADPSLADNDKKVAELLQEVEDEANAILKREGILAE
ncbi:MAG: ABC transporter substrate-binding protein [Rhodospirillales bacterium]